MHIRTSIHIKKVRERARKASTEIERLFLNAETVDLGNGIALSLLMRRPKNFDEHDLDKEIADDELILGMVNRKSQESGAQSGSQILVVSRDTASI